MDFTGGIFSTGIATLELKDRNFIGIEKEQSYFDSGCARVKEYILENNLKIELNIL